MVDGILASREILESGIENALGLAAEDREGLDRQKEFVEHQAGGLRRILRGGELKESPNLLLDLRQLVRRGSTAGESVGASSRREAERQ